MLSIADVVEILSLPLLGIIPENEEVLRASNLGTPVVLHNPMGAAARAYMTAARRLTGKQMDVVIPGERRGLLTKLFGRRAA
jgi:septum site-determining protein MinD